MRMTTKYDKLPYRPCAGIMVLNRDGLVFIGKRADGQKLPEGGDWWQMPQGGIGEEENAEAAARRELYEETNISSIELISAIQGWITYDLPPHLLGKAWKGRYRGQKQKWFAYRFAGTDSEIDVLNPAGGHKPEFIDWKWVPVSKLLELVVPFKRSAYEQILAEFAHLARD